MIKDYGMNECCTKKQSSGGFLISKKFAGKHLCRSLFLIKFQARPMRKSFLVQVFSCEFYEICNNAYNAKYLPAAASQLWRDG